MTWIGFGLAVLGSIWLGLAGEPDLRAAAAAGQLSSELLAMLCATGYTLLLKHLSALLGIRPDRHAGLRRHRCSSCRWSAGQRRPASQPSALGIQAVVYLGVVVTVGAYGSGLQLRRRSTAGQPGLGLHQPDPGSSPWYSPRCSRRNPQRSADARCRPGLHRRRHQPVAKRPPPPPAGVLN